MNQAQPQLAPITTNCFLVRKAEIEFFGSSEKKEDCRQRKLCFSDKLFEDALSKYGYGDTTVSEVIGFWLIDYMYFPVKEYSAIYYKIYIQPILSSGSDIRERHCTVKHPSEAIRLLEDYVDSPFRDQGTCLEIIFRAYNDGQFTQLLPNYHVHASAQYFELVTPSVR